MSSSAPSLPDKPRSRRPFVVAAVVVVALVAAVAVYFGTRGDDTATTSAAGGGNAQTVKIGVADSSLPYWKVYTDLAASQLDVEVDLVNFSDYSLPNPALSQGEVDLNQFQHIQYLANYNTTADDDLQPIGATAIYPLPLYSTTAKTPAEIPQGSQVAIPNDAINQARGLLVLQSAGLLTLKDGGNAFSTTNDVESAKVQVTAVDASQTANALESGSVAAAIVNVNYATSAGLAAEDVIFQDDPSAPSAAPYVNIFASRKADDTNETYLKLAALFQDPAVQSSFAKDYPNAVVKDTSATDLQAELTEVEKDAKAAG